MNQVIYIKGQATWENTFMEHQSISHGTIAPDPTRRFVIGREKALELLPRICEAHDIDFDTLIAIECYLRPDGSSILFRTIERSGDIQKLKPIFDELWAASTTEVKE